MKIDSTFGLEIYGPGGKSKPSAGKAAQGSKSAAAGHEVSISALEKKYLSQVQGVAEVNFAAVADAKKLIASGQLDTPEATDRLASKIVEQGV